MRRLARTFAARIGDKYQIRLTRSTCKTERTPFKFPSSCPPFYFSFGKRLPLAYRDGLSIIIIFLNHRLRKNEANHFTVTTY